LGNLTEGVKFEDPEMEGMILKLLFKKVWGLA
jgi:hypothetical protein